MSRSFYPGFDTRHWNPFVGCDHGARFGCLERCWAREMVARFGTGWGVGGDFRPRLVEKWLPKPLSWRNPQIVPTGFEGDIACFPSEDVSRILSVIALTPQHTYLLLTKDPARLAGQMATWLAFWQAKAGVERLPKNVLMMATVRNQEDADRVIPALLRIPAARYGLSMEPLLGPVNIARYLRPGLESWCEGHPESPKSRWPGGYSRPFPAVSWVVGGCESGRGARWGHTIHYNDFGEGELVPDPTESPLPPDEWQVNDWLRSLRDQCAAAGVAFWCKQLPVFKGANWRVSSDPADFPPDLQIQEKPE